MPANFIPEVMAKSVLLALRNNMVGSSFVNRKYEGEIQAVGDTVNIVSPGAITISDYDKNGTLAWQALTDSQKQLIIDISKSFSFVVDDIDKFQSQPDIQQIYGDEAAFALKEVSDTLIFGKYIDASASNIIDTIVLTKSNIYSQFVNMQKRLNKSKVPLEGRRAAVGPDEYALLLEAPEFVHATADGDKVIASGKVGNIAGFEVFMTNNLTEEAAATVATGTNTQRFLMFTHPNYGITMAEQILNVEKIRLESKFGTGVRGLHVYGLKTVRPDALGVIRVDTGIAGTL